jgi:Domain of unknown function.
MLTELDLTLLARIVERYGDGERPVTPATLSDVIDAEESAIEVWLDELASHELLAPVDGGYRPTITARELLELDIDPEDALVVLEFEAPDDDPVQTQEDSGEDC